MTTLDQISLIESVDSDNLAAHILALPAQIKTGLSLAKKIIIPPAWANCQQVVFCGMGGSGIVGDILADLPMDDQKISMTVVHDYQVPAWVDKNTLVILASHSGQTKETLTAFKSAAANEAQILIVAEKGQIENLGAHENAIIFDYDYLAPPRASIGYQLGGIFGLLKQAQILTGDLTPAISLLNNLNQKYEPQVATQNNLAKNIAFYIFDHVPVIVSSGILTAVGRRWKTQLNENAKQAAFTEIMPEAMHNAIEGLDEPARVRDDLIYIILTNSFDLPDLLNQFDRLKNVLDDKKIIYQFVPAEGEDIFSQKLSILLLGDWVSFYLAMLFNINPTPVETIAKTKE